MKEHENKEKIINLIKGYIQDMDSKTPKQLESNISGAKSILYRLDTNHPRLSVLSKMEKYIDHFCNPEIIGFNPYSSYQDMKDSFRFEMESFVHEIETIGLLPVTDKEKGKTKMNEVNINLSQNQSQQQSQQMALNIFLDAISDELTGKQIKEIKEIMAQEKDIEKAKPKIIEKISSFGLNVASNIIANIITNPNIWNSFQ